MSAPEAIRAAFRSAATVGQRMRAAAWPVAIGAMFGGVARTGTWVE
jgi:predicted nucleotidyltransferase